VAQVKFSPTPPARKLMSIISQPGEVLKVLIAASLATRGILPSSRVYCILSATKASSTLKMSSLGCRLGNEMNRTCLMQSSTVVSKYRKHKVNVPATTFNFKATHLRKYH
jgi:hypothetical protein